MTEKHARYQAARDQVVTARWEALPWRVRRRTDRAQLAAEHDAAYLTVCEVCAAAVPRCEPPDPAASMAQLWEKQIKLSTLLTNAVIFHTTLDMMMVLRQLAAEGWEIKPEDVAVLSPYQTMRINRFGVYATDKISVTPEQYDAHLPDIDLTLDPCPEQRDRGEPETSREVILGGFQP